MRVRLADAILGLSLFLLMPALSGADALYTYSLNLPSSFPSIGPSTVNWTFDEPSILTSSTMIPSSSLLSASVEGVLSSDGCSISSVTILSPTTTGGVSTSFTGCQTPGLLTIFPAAIASYGTFTSADTTLEITSTSEPSSLVFLGLGLVALLGAARFRPHQQ